jgi:hypothetical protein
VNANISQATLNELVERIAKLEAEVKAWRERFPLAGFDGNSIVLSG